jgi:putative oxidoreductase
MINLRRTTVWIGSILLAAAFVMVGLSKLQGASATRWAERFVHWGYPPRAQSVVGMIELLGGIGLLVPRARPAAALVLGALMIGALGTHLLNGEWARVVPPLVLGGVASLIYWLERRLSRRPPPERAGLNVSPMSSKR